jgi:hypothetical protein
MAQLVELAGGTFPDPAGKLQLLCAPTGDIGEHDRCVGSRRAKPALPGRNGDMLSA